MKADLESSLRALEAMAVRHGNPTRHDARPILLSIGAALFAEDREGIREVPSRFQSLPPAFLEAWGAAVRDELTMACTEYVRSVDPRYLDHPRYDLEYTLEARRMLEARVRAAEYLGWPLDRTWSDDVLRADGRLEARAGSKLRDWLAKT